MKEKAMTKKAKENTFINNFDRSKTVQKILNCAYVALQIMLADRIEDLLTLLSSMLSSFVVFILDLIR